MTSRQCPDTVWPEEHAVERNFDENTRPEFRWTFLANRNWLDLDAEDNSGALMRSGILTVSASAPLTREPRFGQPLYWIRGELSVRNGGTPVDYPLPLLYGAYLNAVLASQGETRTDEILGSSDGEPGQKLRFQHASVLEDEDIRVREVLSEGERERLKEQNTVIEREDLDGTWVRWTPVRALFDCQPDDRCYTIDRASGVITFGSGAHGRIPPAGVDNIRAFRYRTSGGTAGNVAAGKTSALAAALTGVESVTNPTPAGGGSDAADTQAMLSIGPRTLSHHDRAVSAQDFEELARDASRQVAKARWARTLPSNIC